MKPSRLSGIVLKASIRAFLVDFGGTHTKWAFSDGLKLIETGQFEAVPVRISDSGRAIIEPNLFIDHVTQLRTHLLERFDVPTDVAFTGQMASYSLVDRNGLFLCPIISWQDFSALKASVTCEWSFENSSVRLKGSTYDLFDGFRPGLPLANLPLIARDYGVAIKGAFFKSMLSVANDVWQFDQVQANSSVHATDAAASGFYNPLKGIWDSSLLEAQGMHGINLPKVIHGFEVLQTDLANGIRYWPAIGDQQAAIFGCDVKPNELFMHVATGAQVAEICNVDFANSAFLAGGKFQIRPYVEEGKVVSTITHLPAGRLLEKAMLLNQQESLSFDLANEIDLEDLEDVIDFKFKFDSKGTFSLENLTLPMFSASNFVKAILVGIPNTLVSAANELPTKEYRSTVLSGGVLMRQRGLRDRLKGLLSSLQFRDNFEEDTSIIGLHRLLQDNL
jgi:hypothetical protein